MRLARFAVLTALVSLLGALAPACTPAPCCQSDGDCGEGLGCFEGACTYACLHDDDCASHELCVRPAGGRSSQGLCVDPGASSGLCPAREPPRRDAGLDDGGPRDASVPPDDAGPGCTADFLEPNDAWEAAAALVASPARLTICADDEDWIRIPATAGDVISAQLAFRHDEGDLDLELYGPEPGQPPVVVSSSGENSERLAFVAHRSGEWRLRIVGVNGAENGYLLSFAAGPEVALDGGPDDEEPSDGGPDDEEPSDGGPSDGGPGDGGPSGPLDGGPDEDAGPVCIVDSFEPNESPAQAASDWSSPLDGHICAGDEDWFAIEATAGQHIFVELTFPHVLGDLDLRLRPPPGGGFERASAGVTDREEIEFIAGVSGTYLLRVHGFFGATNIYALRVVVDGGEPLDAGPVPVDSGPGPVDSGPDPVDSGPDPVDSGPGPVDGGPGPACTDPFEPNDSLAQASVGVTYPAAARICLNDDDWFAIDASPGQQIFARIRFVDALGDLDLRLFGPNGMQVAASGGIDDEERIEHFVSQAGRYTLRVFGFAGATGAYDIELFALDPWTCADDAFEDNDTRFTAAPLADDVVDAQLCPGDADFFRFDVSPGEQITVALAYDAPPGMQLHLAAADGLIGTSNTGSGLETVTFTRDAPARVFARVTGPIDDPRAARPYTVVVQRPQGCVEDAWEANDNFTSATPLPFPGSRTGSACESNADFFVVDPGQVDALTVTLEGVPGVSAHALVLGPTGPGYLGTVTGGAGPVALPLPAETPRPIYLVVASAQPAPYTLRVE